MLIQAYPHIKIPTDDKPNHDETDINYKALVAVFVAALAMWTGAAITEYVYNPNQITDGLVKFFAAT